MDDVDKENEERVIEYDLKIAFKNGIIDGIKRYSWWEDGKQYVGISKKLLEQAIKEVEEEYESLQLWQKEMEIKKK